MKGCSLGLGQATPAVYMKSLYNMIMYGNLNIAKDLNVKVWSLENAKQAYEEFAGGSCPYKMVLDPNGMLQLHGFTVTTCGGKSCSDKDCTNKSCPNKECSKSDCSDKSCKTHCSKDKSDKSSKSSKD